MDRDVKDPKGQRGSSSNARTPLSPSSPTELFLQVLVPAGADTVGRGCQHEQRQRPASLRSSDSGHIRYSLQAAQEIAECRVLHLLRALLGEQILA